jgi:hypothetical protein
MSKRIDDFKAALSGGGARANLFKVIINDPRGVAPGSFNNIASFMCKGANLPASNIGTIEVPFKGRVLKLNGDRTFDNWTITVINDTNFAVRRAFETWMNSINSHVGNLNSAFTPSQYMADLQVQQLAQQFDSIPIYEYEIKDAFPVSVSEIEVSYDSTDTIEEFTVEFAYQYWTSYSTDGDTTESGAL